MKWSDLPIHPTRRMLRQFAVAWVILLLAAGAHQYCVRHHSNAGLSLMACALLGVPALVWPPWIRWPFVLATILTFPIGWAVSQVALAAMFYVVLTPIAWIFRVRRRDPLGLRPPSETASCWSPRESSPEPERYLRQY